MDKAREKVQILAKPLIGVIRYSQGDLIYLYVCVGSLCGRQWHRSWGQWQNTSWLWKAGLNSSHLSKSILAVTTLNIER